MGPVCHLSPGPVAAPAVTRVHLRGLPLVCCPVKKQVYSQRCPVMRCTVVLRVPAPAAFLVQLPVFLPALGRAPARALVLPSADPTSGPSAMRGAVPSSRPSAIPSAFPCSSPSAMPSVTLSDSPVVIRSTLMTTMGDRYRFLTIPTGGYDLSAVGVLSTAQLETAPLFSS